MNNVEGAELEALMPWKQCKHSNNHMSRPGLCVKTFLASESDAIHVSGIKSGFFPVPMMKSALRFPDHLNGIVSANVVIEFSRRRSDRCSSVLIWHLA